MGSCKKLERKEAEKNGDIIFATLKIAEEGIDISRLDTVIYALPIKLHKRLEQSSGRILRLEKYDDLQPPDSFARSVKLFKLSLEYQIDSHEHRLEWIKTGDELELVRFQELTQLSFEAEQVALKSFNDAKAGIQQ